jgi:NADPH:quinone reductase
MKAAQLLDYGDAGNFRIVELPEPSPRPGEVRIRVEYAGLRWGDIMNRHGVPVRAAKPPFVPGQEVAGVVDALGEGVERFGLGDRVVAQPNGGGFAQYVCLPAAAVGRVPDGVSLTSVLVYRVNLPTAYLAVCEWAKVKDGESVLVHAAAGGVGSLAVQILKRRFNDVTVIGVAGSGAKVAEVLRHGADHAIDRSTQDYVAEVERIVGAKPAGFAPGAPAAGVDVVLNGVGGPTLRTDRRVIKRLGRWVLFGTVAGAEPINVYEYAYDSITILPFSMIPFAGTEAMARARRFSRDWLATEPLDEPTVHPIDDIAEVQRAMESGHTIGKVVFAL